MAEARITVIETKALSARAKGRMAAPEVDRAIEVIAARLQPGTSELMAHPGTSEDDSPYNSPYKWKNDLEALLTYSKEEFEKRFDVQLVSYREVQDARL